MRRDQITPQYIKELLASGRLDSLSDDDKSKVYSSASRYVGVLTQIESIEAEIALMEQVRDIVWPGALRRMQKALDYLLRLDK